MMPLLMARRGETNKISAVHGKDEIKRFLANLGFVFFYKHDSVS